METSAAAHWNAAYAEGDEERSWTQPSARESLDAIALTGARRDAPIVDVGGGSSRLAGALVDAGHRDVTVLDISEAALDLARGRLGARAGAVTWIAADLLAWRPEQRYAIWHDRAVLHFFTDDADRDRYAAVLRAAVVPGGHAIVATFAPEGPDRCSGLPVRRSGPDDILRLLGDEFVLVDAMARRHRTPSGTVQPFTWVVARRRPERVAGRSAAAEVAR